MTKYYATITLHEIDVDGTILPVRFNLKSSTKEHPALAVKEAGNIAIEALNVITKIQSNTRQSGACSHVCSCTDSFCCVCDKIMTEDDQAYSADDRCHKLKIKM